MAYGQMTSLWLYAYKWLRFLHVQGNITVYGGNITLHLGFQTMQIMTITKELLYTMNSILGHHSAPQGYAGPGTTWTNEMNLL